MLCNYRQPQLPQLPQPQGQQNVIVYQTPTSQQCKQLVRVKVMVIVNNRWQQKGELVLNQAPSVNTIIVYDGEPLRIESLMLLGSDCESDKYEALVYPITQYKVEVPTPPKSDCGCMGRPVPMYPQERQCGCEPQRTCDPCQRAMLPVYVKGYPW